MTYVKPVGIKHDQPTVVLAFDPGPHTGIALVDFDGTGAVTGIELSTLVHDPNEVWRTYHQIQQIITRTLPYYAQGHSWEREAVDCSVVCETFMTVSPAVSASKDAQLTMRLCGWIEGTCLLEGPYFQWQNPAERKPFSEQARLSKAKTLHEQSALAHALTYGHHWYRS